MVEGLRSKFRLLAEEPRVMVLAAVSLLVAAALSWRPFVNPDLGWQIASGLWMLDEQSLIQADPFGAARAYWHDYSWPFDLLIAVLYRWGGFNLLQFLQFLLGISFAALCLFTALDLSSFRNIKPSIVGVALLVLLLLSSPIWYLRPQFLSLFFLMCTLSLAVKRRLWSLPGMLLLLVWVNIHVFWVFYLLVFALFSVFEVKAHGWIGPLIKLFVLSLFGLFTPYTIEMLNALYSIIFSQQAVYGGVQECLSLGPETGYLFWIWIGVLGCGIFKMRSLYSREPAVSSLFMVFGLTSFFWLRLLPFFGVVVFFLLLLSSAVVRGKETHLSLEDFKTKALLSGRVLVLFGASLIFLLGIGVFFAAEEEVIARRYQELEHAADYLVKIVGEVAPEEQMNVLNHFNDGGFLQLYFYERRARGQSESAFKTLIDSRTVMVGDRPISEFAQLEALSPGWCEVLRRWSPAFAVLPQDMKLARMLMQTEREAICEKRWHLLSKHGRFVVFKVDEEGG